MTNTAITAPTAPSLEGLEQVLINGDLGGLTPDQRIAYYSRVCESVGLNPLTQPLEYLRLNGKTILYARKAATEQLRRIHQVSITIVAKEQIDGCYVVTARATLPSGRTDEDAGSVPTNGLRGEALANATMKAITKAKRRVTLAICGLSVLDESEIEGVQGRVEHVAMPEAPAKQLAPVVQLVVGEHEPDNQERLAAALANKLGTLRSKDEFIAWTREVLAANFPDGIRDTLRTMFGNRCLRQGLDPNLVAKEAKRQPTKLERDLEASIKQEEAERG